MNKSYNYMKYKIFTISWPKDERPRTHHSEVGSGPDRGGVGRGSHLTLVLAVVLECHALDDQVMLALDAVTGVAVAGVAGDGATEAWGG